MAAVVYTGEFNSCSVACKASFSSFTAADHYVLWQSFKHLVLKNIWLCYCCVWFWCLGVVWAKKRGKLRRRVLGMYFLLGERGAGYNGGKLLCVLSVLRHLWNGNTSVSETTSVQVFSTNHFCFLDRMTWMTQREVWSLSALLHTRPNPCSSSWPKQSRETSSKSPWRLMRTW